MVITLTGAKSLAIFLVKDKKNELMPAISEGLSPHILPKVKAGRGILGNTAKTGKRYVSEDIPDTPAAEVDPSLPIACIPLKIQDHVMGIIAVYSLFMKKPAFTDKDHELFDLLARHAATAIFSSRAYKNERKAPGVSWHDSLIILTLSLVFGIVFNLSSPHGIRLLPKVWSDARISTITPLTAMELHRTGNAFFIDAMPPTFFEKEHIKGAVNLPPALFDIMYMLELSEVEKGREIVVYGRTVSSRYDEEVAQKLILRGHKNTRILEGGFSGWKKNGHPVGP
jgi:rhodanese-related sulfurtransferase